MPTKKRSEKPKSQEEDRKITPTDQDGYLLDKGPSVPKGTKVRVIDDSNLSFWRVEISVDGDGQAIDYKEEGAHKKGRMERSCLP